MTPKKYILTSAVTLLLLAIGWFGIVLTILGVPTVSSQPLCNLLSEKQRIARMLTANGAKKRLVLVSGSSTHFGLSALDIETSLAIPTINYGSHAAMPLSVILSTANRFLRSGDTVLLAPEYERYNASGLNDVVIDYLFSCGVDALRRLPAKQQIEAIFALSATRAGAGVAKLAGLDKIAERLAYINLPVPLGERYSDVIQVGPRGDALINKRTAITSLHRGRVAQAAASPLNFDASGNDVRAISSFASWAAANEVEVVATWPNTVNFPEYRTPMANAFFQRIRKFYETLGIRMVGTPEAVLLEPDAFFDHQYHLHRDAVTRRTGNLIPLLCDALKLPEKIEDSPKRRTDASKIATRMRKKQSKYSEHCTASARQSFQ
jgi:hypothetical protein